MIADDDLALLVRPYGVTAREVELLRSNQNHVYACRRDGEKCILRISRGRQRTMAQVRAELEWVGFLRSQGVKACLPIPTGNGEPCVEVAVDGQSCIVTCFEHAPGRAVVPGDISPPIYEKLGRLIGQMHAYTLRFDVPQVISARLHWHESRLVREDVAEQVAVLHPSFREGMEALIRLLREVPVNPQTYGLIHGDACLGNCFVDGDELWIFDFDNCEQGHFLQDLATVLYDSIYCRMLNQFADAGLNDRIVPLWKALLRGYSETGPLAVAEIDPMRLKQWFLLREAMIYVHYHRVLDVGNVNDSFKAGLEVMRGNVERQEHQVNFERLVAPFAHEV